MQASPATFTRLPQVFDGHSGEAAARFAEQHLLPNLLREETFLTAPAEALVCLRPSLIQMLSWHGSSCKMCSLTLKDPLPYTWLMQHV